MDWRESLTKSRKRLLRTVEAYRKLSEVAAQTDYNGRTFGDTGEKIAIALKIPRPSISSEMPWLCQLISYTKEPILV